MDGLFTNRFYRLFTIADVSKSFIIMEYTTTVKKISEDIVEILGNTYYSEDYLKIMMERRYEKGIREGQQKPQVHIAQIEKCHNCG